MQTFNNFRLLWIALVVASTLCSILLGLEGLNRYQTRPTVISLERDHWKWNSNFPSTTLCINAIDEDKADELIG